MKMGKWKVWKVWLKLFGQIWKVWFQPLKKRVHCQMCVFAKFILGTKWLNIWYKWCIIFKSSKWFWFIGILNNPSTLLHFELLQFLSKPLWKLKVILLFTWRNKQMSKLFMTFSLKGPQTLTECPGIHRAWSRDSVSWPVSESHLCLSC